MVDTTKNRPSARDWRFPLITGLTIGLALPASQAVQRNLEPSLGYGGALGVSILAAGIGAGLASLVLSWLIKPRGSGCA